MTQRFDTHLTAAEAGALWTHYIGDSLLVCMLDRFMAKVEDDAIRPVITFAAGVSRQQMERVRAILASDDFPVPIGLTPSDINLTAPRLYSDPFFLSYVRNMARGNLIHYSLSLTIAAREDVRAHFRQSIAEAVQVDDRAVRTEQTKGLYVRSPYIPSADKPEFVQNSDFFGSIFGARRPLTAVEIGNIFVGCQNNIMGKALMMGFAQVAEARELREFFLRGKQIAHKHIEILSAILIDNDLPAPMSLDSYVINSTVAPFSDRLMLQHTQLVNQAGLNYYGLALAATARSDISGAYVRLLTESMQYLEDAGHIMVRHRWLEQPPMAQDRRSLVMR